MDYLKRAMEIKEEIIANRRYLHQIPELGMELPKTSGFVVEKLREMGYEPKLISGYGVTATVGKKTDGKVILLRADMDALPMEEESGLPFAAKGKCAHTCGHDLHTAMLLAAAKMLKESEEELEGIVKLVFQPGEETLEGAKALIADGILENPKVDAAMAAHVIPLLPTGFIGYNKGVVAASADYFIITLHGLGSHGACPQLSIDPINMGVHLHLALQELISREANPEEMVVLTVGKFQSGAAGNVIPEKAVLEGTLRTFNEEVRSYMLKRIQEVTDGVASTFRGSAEIKYKGSVCSLNIDSQMADIIGEALKEMLGEKGVAQVDQRMSGSEDFAEIAAKVPSMFFIIGTGSAEEGYCYGGHHPKVIFNEDCLPIGAAAYAQGAARWLERAK